jgi:hypothetical protein
MKHNYQNIIKKTYAKPVIEEVMIDVAISLQSPTGDPGEDDPIEDPPPLAPLAPKYSTEYKSESPFGGAEPRY